MDASTLRRRPAALCRLAVLGAFLAAASGPVPASRAVAQEPAATIARSVGDFRESYDATAKVAAGSPLVGLQLGDGNGKLGVDRLRILVPLATRSVCVSSATQDGRFSATNQYEAEAATSPVWRLDPVTRAYRDELSAYHTDAFAVRAYVPAEAGGCAARGAVHVPLLAGGADRLLILANSRSRRGTAALFASLSPAAASDQPLASVRCEPAGQSTRIAFDLRCELPLPELSAPEELSLRLTFDDGFGLDSYDYRLALPAGGGQP